MVQDKFDPSPSQIPHDKWAEIQQEECANHIINSICEEIVLTAMNAVYKSSFVNKPCTFVVDCAHTAWLQLFNWMNLECESGDISTTLKNDWADDEKRRSESVPPDSWVFGNVEIRRSKNPINDHCTASCEQMDDIDILPENIKRPSLPNIAAESIESPVDKVNSQSEEERSTELTRATNSEELIVDEEREASRCSGTKNEEAAESSDRSEALSIFTRTIDMPEQQLPIGRWSTTGNQLKSRLGGDESHRKSTKSWTLGDVKPARKISLDRLPEKRVGIKYILVTDQRASSNPSEEARKSAPSRTLARKSKGVRPKQEN